MMAALCLWKFHSAGGHVSVCLTWFRIGTLVYIVILLRLVFVRLSISADLCCYDMTRGGIRPGSCSSRPRYFCVQIPSFLEVITEQQL